MSKIKSRKLWIALLSMVVAIVVPILYQKFGMSEALTFAVLGVVASVGAVYGGLNVLDTKFGKKE